MKNLILIKTVNDIFNLNSLGTVTRVTSVKLVEWEKEFVCMKCRFVFKITGDFERNYAVSKPTHCPAPEGCSSIKFSCLSNSGECFSIYKNGMVEYVNYNN